MQPSRRTRMRNLPVPDRQTVTIAAGVGALLGAAAFAIYEQQTRNPRHAAIPTAPRAALRDGAASDATP
jgi:hypothetical protein